MHMQDLFLHNNQCEHYYSVSIQTLLICSPSSLKKMAFSISPQGQSGSILSCVFSALSRCPPTKGCSHRCHRPTLDTRESFQQQQHLINLTKPESAKKQHFTLSRMDVKTDPGSKIQPKLWATGVCLGDFYNAGEGRVRLPPPSSTHEGILASLQG